MELDTCYVGDCRDILRQMSAAGIVVQTCVSSPPYWGLRDYGIPPSIWGGDPDCAHEWGDELRVHKGGPHGDGVLKDGGRGVVAAQAAVKNMRAGQFCQRCNAWLGNLGLEPDYRMFIDHMVEVFDLVREVLADDGMLWLNMGDSHVGGGTGMPTTREGARVPSGWTRRARPGRGRPGGGLKSKDLCLMPARIAIALQEAGWWVRSDIVWHKPNPMPESVTDRPTKSHEYIFLLSKSERYYYDADAIKEPASLDTHPRGSGNRRHKGAEAYEAGASEHRTNGGLVAHAERTRSAAMQIPDDWATVEGFEPPGPEIKAPDGWDTTKGQGGHGSVHKRVRDKGKTRTLGKKLANAPDDVRASAGARMGRGAGWRKLAAAGSGIKNNDSFDEAMAVMPENRNKRTVWTVTTQPFKEAHFATFPPRLIEPCILAGSRPGDVVLDPFMGSGTTAQVAEALGRRWIGAELNEEYLALQESRLAQRTLSLA